MSPSIKHCKKNWKLFLYKVHIHLLNHYLRENFQVMPSFLCGSTWIQLEWNWRVAQSKTLKFLFTSLNYSKSFLFSRLSRGNFHFLFMLLLHVNVFCQSNIQSDSRVVWKPPKRTDKNNTIKSSFILNPRCFTYVRSKSNMLVLSVQKWVYTNPKIN